MRAMRGPTPLVVIVALLAACASGPVIDDETASEGVEVAGEAATAEPDPEPLAAREPALPERTGGEAVAQSGPAGDTTTSGTPTGSAPAQDEADATSTEDRSMSTSVPPDLIDAMKADLANRLGVDPSTIRLVSGRSVTWSDSSLGCPEPEQMYLQVLTDGYQVILEAGGAQYDYRADTRGNFKLCQNPSGGGEVGQDS
jgi:hypothetical protein